MKTIATHVINLLLILSIPMGALRAQSCDIFLVEPSPSPDPQRSVLTRVTGTSSSNAWAYGTMGTPSVPLLMHWDGSSWTQRPMPALPPNSTPQCLGSTDDGISWMGAQGTPVANFNGHPVVARASNGTFDQVHEIVLPPQTVFPYAQRSGRPYDMDGISENDLWVLTEAAGNGDGLGESFFSALHYNGSVWSETILPDQGTDQNHPRAIEVIASDDIWVVGYGKLYGSAPFTGMLYHYDGNSWTYVPSPLEGTPSVFFLDVSASGSDDVWVVGYINYTDPIYLHYNGTVWTQVPGPAVAAPVRVIALAPDNAWASPYSLHDSDSYFHWDGSVWNEVPGPTPAGSTDIRRGTDMVRIGACEAWSVGYFRIDDVRYTLAERLGPLMTQVGGQAIDELYGLSIYPNPATDRINLQFELLENMDMNVELCDVSGRVIAILAKERFHTGLHTIQWQASGLTNGIYHVHVRMGEALFTKRIVVSR